VAKRCDVKLLLLSIRQHLVVFRKACYRKSVITSFGIRAKLGIEMAISVLRTFHTRTPATVSVKLQQKVTIIAWQIFVFHDPS